MKPASNSILITGIIAAAVAVFSAVAVPNVIGAIADKPKQDTVTETSGYSTDDETDKNNPYNSTTVTAETTSYLPDETETTERETTEPTETETEGTTETSSVSESTEAKPEEDFSERLPSEVPTGTEEEEVVVEPVKGSTEDKTETKGETTDGYSYVVQKGETLDDIADKCGVSVDALMKANTISDRSYSPVVGEVIEIPVRGDGKG